jgi:tetratricopeptide (TPR) repeat protein
LPRRRHGPERKSDANLKIRETPDSARPGGPPVSLVNYAARGQNGKTMYMVRGFTGTGDICGDLEFYSDTPISSDDAVLKKAFASYRFDESYSPQFTDAFFYAQVLYQTGMYKAAAPIFEIALARLNEHPEMATMRDAKTTRRVTTDQAGNAYGMSGDIQKARTLFEKAIAEDPDYPMYYYNLACADAEDKNLAGARQHLQEAFARKANVISGETMPDPTTDDSFLPYRDIKEFWAFLKSLRP